jgi:hypothetical protein
MYYLNYLCYTWSHGRHLIYSSIALFLKALTFPNGWAFILSKLLIALMGVQSLGAAVYTLTAHECTQSMLNVLRHAWYVVPQYGPLDLGRLKGCLQFTCHRVIRGSVIGCNSESMGISQLKTFKHIVQMSG